MLMNRPPRGSEFPALAARVYLNTAAEGLGSRSLAEALARYAQDKMRGAPGRDAFYEQEARARAGVARLLGVPPSVVAFSPSTTDAINTVLWGLDWQPGDEIVVTDLEFPTGIIAALHLADRRGVTVRVVRHVGGAITAAAIEEALGPRTRLVLLSHVSYRSGYRFDLGRVTRAAHAAGAMVLVDAAQSLGAVPVNAGDLELDFVVAPAFKWLLAAHGAAVLCCGRAGLEVLRPPFAGWRSVGDFFRAARDMRLEMKADAGRLETGMLNYEALYALAAGLDLLERAGAAPVAHQVLQLSAHAVSGLRRLGVEPLTPGEADQRAGIVAFETERFRPIGEALAAQGIDVWYGDGRVRLSAHYYNTGADIDSFLGALSGLL
jgi:cysteine desulfurase / selenocysteine lyase